MPHRIKVQRRHQKRGIGKRSDIAVDMRLSLDHLVPPFDKLPNQNKVSGLVRSVPGGIDVDIATTIHQRGLRGQHKREA
jgi:hypothetical protein